MGLITRSREKKMKDALQVLVHAVQDQVGACRIIYFEFMMTRIKKYVVLNLGGGWSSELSKKLQKQLTIAK